LIAKSYSRSVIQKWRDIVAKEEEEDGQDQQPEAVVHSGRVSNARTAEAEKPDDKSSSRFLLLFFSSEFFSPKIRLKKTSRYFDKATGSHKPILLS
jgi:hypothetical protein